MTDQEVQQLSRSRFLAVSGIILSTCIMALSSGLMFSYIPLKLLSLGFEPWVPASMMPALAFGGLFGCLATGPLLRLSGHARIFMLFYAMTMISIIILALSENAYAWLFSRAIYGFAVNGIFIVAQSWLHHAAIDEIRGRIITAFYVGYVLCLGIGSYFIGFVDISGNNAPVFSTLFIALAILPVALTKLKQPEAPTTLSVDIKKVWKISPVGLVGMLTVGGLTTTLQTFSPIYASDIGYSNADVGLLLALMQVGLLIVQVPMGALSDKVDRRMVLLMATVGASVMVSVAYNTSLLGSLALLIIVFALWNGFNETIYSVSSALANDRAKPEDFVMLSSTQMICWSLAAFIVPLISTGAALIFPLWFFMPLCFFLTVAFTIFVLFRMSIRDEVGEEKREDFQNVTSQVAFPGDYSNPDVYDEDEAGSTSGLVS